MTLRVGSLCSGYGGLELALDILGIEHQVAWFAETAPAASALLAHRWPSVPNLGDLTRIVDVEPVDLVTAGFPCQPVSQAGARLGPSDRRWIIRDVVRIWRASRARWLILENVPGLLTANDGDAFGQVLDALAEVGASAEWTRLRASDVGACHKRERWFCVATDPDASSVGRVEGP